MTKTAKTEIVVNVSCDPQMDLISIREILEFNGYPDFDADFFDGFFIKVTVNTDILLPVANLLADFLSNPSDPHA